MVLKTFFRLDCISGLLLGTLAVACQGGNLTLPGDASPARLRALSGAGQQGTVGSQLPDPLVVQVLDAAGRPVPQVSLRFETQVPDAQVPAEAVTNDSGKAEVRVRLGETEGTQRFDALLADASDVRTTFEVFAVAQHPSDDGGSGGGGDHGHDDDDHDDTGDGGHGHDDDGD